jgi:hypothetical protein
MFSKPDVQHEHRREHEGRAVEAELPSALDRLRDAELRALSSMQGDQQRADQRADRDGDDGPPERQADRDHHGAEYDVEDVDVAAEPEGELMPRLAMPGLFRYALNMVRLDEPLKLLLVHDLDIMHGGVSPFGNEGGQDCPLVPPENRHGPETGLTGEIQ